MAARGARYGWYRRGGGNSRKHPDPFQSLSRGYFAGRLRSDSGALSQRIPPPEDPHHGSRGSAYNCAGPNCALFKHLKPLIMKFSILSLSGSALLCPGFAQSLLIPESSNDQVMEFSSVDGSLINASFIDLTAGAGTGPVTPIEAITVGSEIWISDQGADIIHVWSADGSTYIGEVGIGRDNMRGLGLASNGQVYVSNSGGAGAGFGDTVKEYGPDGTFVAAYAAGDPFDVHDTGTELLVSNILADTIDRFDYAGNQLGSLTNATFTGAFPEQVVPFGADYLVGSFITGGIHVIDGATGDETAFYDTGALGFGGVRGVAPLQTGEILFTNGSGVHTYNIAGNSVTTVMAGVSARFISGGGTGNVGLGMNYCDQTTPNSSGNLGELSAFGSDVAAANNFTLTSSGLPDGEFSYFVASQTQGFIANPNNSQGNLCVLGNIARFNRAGEVGVISGGSWSISVDTTDVPEPSGTGSILMGETWNFQGWHRDFVGAPTSNFTNGLSVMFQ